MRKNSLKNKIYIYLALLFLLLLVIFSILSVQNVKQTFSFPTTIVIDPGHGGIDKGCCGRISGVEESFVNLEISLLLGDILTERGVNVVYTRTSDVGLYGDTSKGFKARDMKKRAEIVENASPALVLSVHCNSSSRLSASGVVAYSNEENAQSVTLAHNLIKRLTTLDNLNNAGSVKHNNLFMTHKVNAPSVIIECGFLSNANEEQRLLDPFYRLQLANKLALAIFDTLE